MTAHDSPRRPVHESQSQRGPAAQTTSDERAEIGATARSLLEHECPIERVRAAVAAEPGFDRALWAQLVDLGFASILIPETAGGMGAGYAELAVILHELGRAVAPSPFLASATLATTALTLALADGVASSLLGALASGDVLASVAIANADGSYEPSRLTTSWARVDGAVRVAGAAGFVPDADVADHLIVAARDDSGTTALVVVDTRARGVCVERLPTVDVTRRLFRVELDDIVVASDRLLGEPGAPAEALVDRVVAAGVLAAMCDATGAAERVLERAVEYAKERTQFGKPIGSFQAVKHHCADMAIRVVASRAAVRAAASAFDSDPDGWATTAAVAASYVGPACTDVCALGLRIHGGIGFTWEHESHLYLKRTKLDEVLFGTPSWHRRRLADTIVAALTSED
jgi:alkylation response protein AidB-like acyl-CoA dehydrogenase